MNPLTLSIIGLYKTAVIRRRGSWRPHAGAPGTASRAPVHGQSALETELKQILDDLGLGERICVERSRVKSPGNDE